MSSGLTQTKTVHFQNLQVMGTSGGRTVRVAERHPDLYCVWISEVTTETEGPEI